MRQEFARLNKSRTGFEPRQADGRQPFMPQEYLTIPVFELYLFGCADFEADAAAFLSRARRERLSSSDLISPYHGFCFL